MRQSQRKKQTSSTNKSLKDLLPKALSAIDKKVAKSDAVLFCAWEALMGPKMAPLAQAVSFVEGVLTVEVKSATLYSCLCQYERQRLLKSMQEKCPDAGIKNLYFRRR